MRQGDKFPPVKLTYDGANYWLTDGFHTTEAAWSIGQKDIEAIITKGSQRDAILASVGVNSDHGLRRSNADKRRAVTTLLEDEEWGKWSDREISKRCKVHHSTVAKIRQELTGYLASDNPKKYIDKYGNVYSMNTQKIGSDNTAELITDKELIVNNSAARFGGSAFGKEDSFPKRDPYEDSHPKAAATDKQDTLQTSCLDKTSAVQISCPDRPLIDNQKLIEQFEIGQLVKLQLSHLKSFVI